MDTSLIFPPLVTLKAPVSYTHLASSKNGIHIDERSETPAYALKRGFLESLTKTNAPGYSSGGSVSGCEDPRIAEIDGTIYLIYTTFSNWSELRLTLASISKEDVYKRQPLTQ